MRTPLEAFALILHSKAYLGERTFAWRKTRHSIAECRQSVLDDLTRLASYSRCCQLFGLCTNGGCCIPDRINVAVMFRFLRRHLMEPFLVNLRRDASFACLQEDMIQFDDYEQLSVADACEEATQAGQAAHHQLINFGANAAGNLDYLGDAAHDLWMDFHHGFDGHLNNTHQGLMAFGHGVEGLLGRVSPTLAGLWHGFQDQVDKSIDSSKDRLESLGNIVAANIQHGKQQVGASWQSIRDNVDRPLSLGLGTPVSPPSVAASLAA